MTVVDVLSKVGGPFPAPVELSAIAWEKNIPFVNDEEIIMVENRTIMRMFFILILPFDVKELKLCFMQSRMKYMAYAYNQLRILIH